jgi:hypothetical protein
LKKITKSTKKSLKSSDFLSPGGITANNCGDYSFKTGLVEASKQVHFKTKMVKFNLFSIKILQDFKPESPEEPR